MSWLIVTNYGFNNYPYMVNISRITTHAGRLPMIINISSKRTKHTHSRQYRYCVAAWHISIWIGSGVVVLAHQNGSMHGAGIHMGMAILEYLYTNYGWFHGSKVHEQICVGVGILFA